MENLALVMIFVSILVSGMGWLAYSVSRESGKAVWASVWTIGAVMWTIVYALHQ